MKRFALLILFLATQALPAQARQDLPDLAPREVEITGDLTIAFPTLRRQPIVGFNPPPRVPDIPSNRRPFTEAYRQESADLPPSPLQAPEPPSVSAIERRIPATGLLDIRIGAHLDRSADADIALLETPTTTALLDFSYFGTDGHDVVTAGNNLKSGRDLLSGGVSLEQRAGPLVVGVGVDGFRNKYGLFGSRPSFASPAQIDPERTFSGLEGSLSLKSRPGSRIRLGLETVAGQSHATTGLYDPDVRIDPATERDESYLKLATSAIFPIRDGSIRIEARGTSSGLDASGFPGSTIKSGMTGGYIKWLYSSKMEVRAGAYFMGFDSASQTGTDPARSLTWVAPLARIDYLVSKSITLTAGTEPSIGEALQREAFDSNPYLMDEPRILPTLTSFDASLGVVVQSDFVSASVKAGWRDQPFRRYAFQPASLNRGYLEGYPALAYDDARVMYSMVDVSVIPIRGLQVGVDALIQQTKLDAADVTAPYVSPMSIGGFVALSLLDGDLESRVDFLHEGARSSDLTEQNDVPAITRVNLMVSWFFHPNYGMTTGVRSLGSTQEFWSGYPMENNSFFLGFRYRW